MRRLLIALTALVLLGGITSAATAQQGSNPDSGPKKDNPNPPDQLPGCNPSDQQPQKCPGDDDGGGGGGGNHCTDGIDNEGDGFTDADDPDCQPGGPGDEINDNSGGGVNHCTDGIDNEGDGFTDADDPDCQPGGPGDEINDNSGGGQAEPCSTGGLLTDKTIGQTLWDGGLQIPPLTEDPDANGPLSGPLSTAADGTPLQPVFLEGGCAVDLVIDETTGADL